MTRKAAAGLVMGLLSTSASGQPVALNPGVDTTDQRIRAVAHLWSSYLRAEATHNAAAANACWAAGERQRLAAVDLLRHAVSTETSTYATGHQTILSITPRGPRYEIKTLFSWPDSAGAVYAFAVGTVFAQPEGDTFRLANALTVNAARWRTRRQREVTFHYPPAHRFSRRRARQLLAAIDRLRGEWGGPPLPFDYYFADTYEEVQHLRGLDYALGMGNAPRPGGMADPTNRLVFAGGLGEAYFHEVVHLYLNPRLPASPLLEGLAVFYGGSLGHDLRWHLARLHAYLRAHPAVELRTLESLPFLDQYTNPMSTLQGLVCQLAYEAGGIDRLRQLVAYPDATQALREVFGVGPEDLNRFLREQVARSSQ